MSAERFSIVDGHHHVGSLEAQGFSFGAVAEGEDPAAVELERRVAAMNRQGVEQAIVIPGHGYLRPDGIGDTRAVNDRIAAYRDASPERFPAAVGISEPLHGEAAKHELRRMRDELGLVGLSVHARFQGVMTDSPLVIDLVRAAAELGLVPFIHAVEGVPDEAMWRVQEVARAVPETTLIVLDAFSGPEHARQAVVIARDTPNLVFDTSLAHHYLFVDAMFAAVGHERVVFGTDYYSMMDSPQHSASLEGLLASSMRDDHKAAVLGGNLRRLLDLDANG